MAEEKKPYIVLNPIAHGGRIERGETVLLSDEEAAAFSAEDIKPAPEPATAGDKVEGGEPVQAAENTDSQETQTSDENH